MKATIIYPDCGEQHQDLSAAPKPGDAIAGPMLDGGMTWRVKAVSRHGELATIECEAVPAPDMIFADLRDVDGSADDRADWIIT